MSFYLNTNKGEKYFISNSKLRKALLSLKSSDLYAVDGITQVSGPTAILKKIGVIIPELNESDCISTIMDFLNNNSFNTASIFGTFENIHLIGITYLVYQGLLTQDDLEKIISARSLKTRTNIILAALAKDDSEVDLFSNLFKEVNKYNNKKNPLECQYKEDVEKYLNQYNFNYSNYFWISQYKDYKQNDVSKPFVKYINNWGYYNPDYEKKKKAYNIFMGIFAAALTIGVGALTAGAGIGIVLGSVVSAGGALYGAFALVDKTSDFVAFDATDSLRWFLNVALPEAANDQLKNFDNENYKNPMTKSKEKYNQALSLGFAYTINNSLKNSQPEKGVRKVDDDYNLVNSNLNTEINRNLKEESFNSSSYNKNNNYNNLKLLDNIPEVKIDDINFSAYIEQELSLLFNYRNNIFYLLYNNKLGLTEKSYMRNLIISNFTLRRSDIDKLYSLNTVGLCQFSNLIYRIIHEYILVGDYKEIKSSMIADQINIDNLITKLLENLNSSKSMYLTYKESLIYPYVYYIIRSYLKYLQNSNYYAYNNKALDVGIESPFNEDKFNICFNEDLYKLYKSLYIYRHICMQNENIQKFMKESTIGALFLLTTSVNCEIESEVKK